MVGGRDAADPRVARAGGLPAEAAGAAALDSAGAAAAGGGIAAESGRKPTGAWVSHATSTLENVLLGDP